MVDGIGDEKAGGSAPTVFISYASQDVAVANAVVAALECHDVKCWIAPRDVVPGVFYAGAIVHAIDASKVIVLVLSESAANSQHVLREVERASSQRHPVVAFRIDRAPMPAELQYFLNTSHWLDASATGVEHSLPKLVDAVQRVMAPPAAAAPGNIGGAPKPAANGQHRPIVTATRHRLRRPMLALGVLIALGLVSFAAHKLWFSKHTASAGPVASEPTAATPVTPAISEKSVAVLPFVDMSEKKDQEYFSDGLSEELIDMLTKIPELRVPARTSSFYFKGKQVTISEIARALGVAHVLEGSVRKSGATLRITAQLIRVDSGYHLWSETYDRQVDDIFKVQDEIAGAVVKALKVSLLDGEAPSATLTSSSEAYELYLQARSLLHGGTSDDSLRAYADLQRALQLDPKFALAWAQLAGTLSDDGVNWTRVFRPNDSPPQAAATDPDAGSGWSQADTDRNWAYSWEQARAAAHAAAEQAIRFGPALGTSHMAMGLVLSGLDRNWTAADVEMKKARELAPGKAGITLAAAQLAMRLGRLPEALQLASRGLTQDPLGEAVGLLGYIQYVSGDLEGAEVSIRKSLELYPIQTGVHSVYAFVLLARGEPQVALTEFERESAPQFRDVGVPSALDALGRRSEADRAIALAEQKWGNGMAWNIGCFYGRRNDADQAFRWLERAYRQHDGGMSELKVEPALNSLRRDPRYEVLLHKMNLPD